MAKTTRDLIANKLTAIEGSPAKMAKSIAGALNKALRVYDTLPTVRAPIIAQAESEQRNEAWHKAAVNKAFGDKLVELARLRHDVALLHRAHDASKPTIPPIDRTDLLSVMETISLAQRVAATPPDQVHHLSRDERIAALRVPATARLSPETAQFWHDQIVQSDQPELFAAHQEDAAALRDANDVLFMVQRGLQEEAGFVGDSGGPTHAWSAFEREHLAPLHDEIRASDAATANQRRDAATVANDAALSDAARRHRDEMDDFRRLLR
ncbi:MULTISPECIES: hypothetical protein [Rhodopseudomonas]|uniref:Uncharacterized protein n=1 Tax=Rhodopseudomonas palustris TaxID=1076 RepID=A0A0D7EBG1_RHOPL|nr:MULTISPECIES: hypothetical protein [Rhodopseudomonas]KIZ38063.1 hypothetical protein OO17_23125 [Rhodopseudomonas palustris]MDF3810539.1 hypothetical protein [Rhodopseudomonas sp. BAL398]WOK18401.1 hypothetical protein RBJ75_02390 [Rhodopseudomonas sp. BAL398]